MSSATSSLTVGIRQLEALENNENILALKEFRDSASNSVPKDSAQKEFNQQYIVRLHQQLVSSSHPKNKAKICEELTKKLPLSLLKRLRLILNWNNFAEKEKILWDVIIQQDFYISDYNHKLWLNKKTLQNLLRYYKELKKLPESPPTIDVLKQARTLIHHLNNHDNVSAVSLKDKKLKAIIKQHEKEHEHRHSHAYDRIRYTFYKFITSPYSTSLKSYLNARSIDKETYDVLVVLNYLGNRKFLAMTFKEYFEKDNLTGEEAEKQLKEFLDFVISRFRLLNDFDLKSFNLSDEKKEKNILSPFRKKINRFSQKYGFAKKVTKDESGIYVVKDNQHLTRKKINYLEKKKNYLWLGNVLSLLVAAGQGFLFSMSLVGIGLLAYAVVPIGLASVYATYYLLKEENREIIQEFFITKRFFGSFTSWKGKIFAGLPCLALSASFSSAMGILAFGAVMTAMPAMIFTVPLATLLGVLTVASFTGMLYMNLIKKAAEIRDGYNIIAKNGLLPTIDTSVQKISKAWQKMNARERLQTILKYIVRGGFLTVGACLFAFSLIATAGAWQHEFIEYATTYFHFTEKAATMVGYVFIMGLPSVCQIIFTGERFASLFNRLANAFNSIVVKPLTNLFTTYPKKTVSKIANFTKDTAYQIKKFVKNIPIDPWKTTFPLLSLCKNLFIKLPAVLGEAAGSAALSAEGYGTLVKVFPFLNPRAAKLCASTAEFTAALGTSVVSVFHDNPDLPPVIASTGNHKINLDRVVKEKSTDLYTSMSMPATPTIERAIKPSELLLTPGKPTAQRSTAVTPTAGKTTATAPTTGSPQKQLATTQLGTPEQQLQSLLANIGQKSPTPKVKYTYTGTPGKQSNKQADHSARPLLSTPIYG